MRSWLTSRFGPRLKLQVTILGVVGERLVQWRGEVTAPAGSDLRQALRAAGRAAGADLLAALDSGAQPTILLDGRRIDLPSGLSESVGDGATIAWLMPLAGG